MKIHLVEFLLRISSVEKSPQVLYDPRDDPSDDAPFMECESCEDRVDHVASFRLSALQVAPYWPSFP
jgi:hypothetical protein